MKYTPSDLECFSASYTITGYWNTKVMSYFVICDNTYRTSNQVQPIFSWYSPYFHIVYTFQLCKIINDVNSLLWKITRLHVYLQNRHLWKNVEGVDHHLTPPLKTQAFVFSSFQSWWQFFWETDNNNMSSGTLKKQKQKKNTIGAFANVFNTVVVLMHFDQTYEGSQIIFCVPQQSYLSSAPHSLCFC